MPKRKIARAILGAAWFRDLVSNSVPQILKYYRRELPIVTVRVRILAHLYSLALTIAAVLLFPWKRLQLLVVGVKRLHVDGDISAAVTCLKEAAGIRPPLVTAVAAGLARVELITDTRDSRQNRLILLKFANEIYDDGDVRYQLALAHLSAGESEVAGQRILEAIQLQPACAMAHQNMAAKYDRLLWKPEPLDLAGDPEIHLYDAYHLLGQLLVNIGDAVRGLEMFGMAMKLQKKLCERYPLPESLVSSIEAHEGYQAAKPIRIVPYEWVTQIGHLGMLDALIKMSRLGMRPDVNWVLLAPDDKVVNQAFLDCWTKHFLIIRDKALVAKLFPYQRACGEQFNCYVQDDGKVVDWSDAAAQAFVEWDKRQLGSLISASEEILQYGRAKLAAIGVPSDAWFVVLHARSSGFYGEGLGFIQKHRNAPLSSYLPAIDAIVKHGGWVLRMGDPSMPKLKAMPQVIDVAHSTQRSKKFDVFIWSQCRFFLGTTSGPTNAVVSFHTPTLLVNCVSNYAQSWNNRVMFVLKPFWSIQQRRFLNYRETFAPKLRASMFNARSMAAEGIYPRANTSEDILVATEEMLARVQAQAMTPDPAENPMHDLGVPPWLWGNATPSRRYLDKHPELLRPH
jgi:putative glycosyltransferase (TIGR04372 family)